VDREAKRIPNIIIFVAEEFTKDVDGHHPQSGICFNFQDSQNGFVQDRVADVLRRVGVGGNLCSNIEFKCYQS
jgi:hypothetical protein